MPWRDLEAALSDRRGPAGEPGRSRLRATAGTARPGPTSGRPTGRQPTWPARPEPASAGRGAVRRAALPLQLQLPRRGLPPRGAGRGGGPPGPGGAGHHRPRRHVRGGPLRRGGPGGRDADGVRGRAVPRADPPAKRGGRPGGHPPAGPGPGPHRLHPAVPGPLGGPSVRPGKRAAVGGPRDPRRHWGRGACRTSARRPASDRRTRLVRPGAHADHWVVLTGCRKGIVPAALVAHGPARAAVRAGPPPEAVRAGPTWWWSCGTTATRSTRPATTPWSPSPTGAAPRSWPPTTSTTTIPPAGRWPRPWPRCGPGAAWTTSTAGCRPRPPPTCAAGPSRPGASPVIPAWWSGPPRWAGSAPSTWPWWRPTCHRGRSRRATPR